MTGTSARDNRIFWVLLLAFSLLFFRLGDRSFRNPDEGRYAEIAREMVISGDWREPTLFGVDYLKKPVLFYWLVAASFKCFGFHEWAARTVPALFALFGILSAYLFTRRYIGKDEAFVAALILAANPLYVTVSRLLLIDAVFSFFLTGAFFWAYAALEKKSPLRICLFYTFLAFGFLAKGVIAVAIPFFVLTVYLLLTNQIKKGIWRFLSPTGVLLFALITLPWFIAISFHEPEFFNIFFWREHVSRLVSKSFEHQEPWHYYWLLLPVVFLPWTVIWPPLRRLRTQRTAGDPRFFLLTALFGTVLFYSISRSKLVTYLLPVLPLGSILLGDAWAGWMREKGSRRRVLAGCLGLLCAVSVIVLFVMERNNANYTTRHFASALKPRLSPQDKIFVYGTPGAFYDFPFYLDRLVKVVIGAEGELVQDPDEDEVKEAMITPDEWKRLASSERIYCLMRRSDYEDLDPFIKKNSQILLQDPRKVLLETFS